MSRPSARPPLAAAFCLSRPLLFRLSPPRKLRSSPSQARLWPPRGAFPRPHLPPEAYTALDNDSTPLCRLITGMWQTSGHHGYTPERRAVTRAIDALVDAGFSSFDVASSYGFAASFARDYARLVGRAAASRQLQFCPRLDVRQHQMQSVNARVVHQMVDDVLLRLSLDRIHLLQLSWADFEHTAFVDFLGELAELKRLGKIRSFGTVNFPTYALKHLESQGVRVASNQVSFSLLDRRAVVDMAEWCRVRGIGLIGYSALGGGFISERYLGLPEPSRRACATPSLMRFAMLIRLWGGWSLFQELLHSVKKIADKHGVSMPNVAVKWALQQPALSAVVVGARLGMAPYTDHIRSNLRAFEFSLDDDDLEQLRKASEKGNDLHRILGDCGSEFEVNG